MNENYELHLPSLSHWEYGNPWSGLRGTACYYVTPADGVMTAELWRGPMARAFVEPELTAQFPISQEGIEQLRAWLLEGFEKINKG